MSIYSIQEKDPEDVTVDEIARRAYTSWRPDYEEPKKTKKREKVVRIRLR
jgi:hypothetical protein